MAEHYLNVGVHVKDDPVKGIGFMNKVDLDGNEIWNRSFEDPVNNYEFRDATNAGKNGYVATGSAYFPDNSIARGWMVKVDTDGNEKWNRLYTAHPRTSDHEYLYKVVDLPDGSFVAAGSSFGQNENGLWTQDGWLLRVECNECSTPNCSGDLAINEVPSGNESLDIYPNPFSGVIFLEGISAFPAQTKVSLMDNLGRIVKLLASPSGKTKMEYDLGGMTPGMYYLKIDVKGRSVQKKITLMP